MINCELCINAKCERDNNDQYTTGSINVIKVSGDQYYTCIHSFDILVRGSVGYWNTMKHEVYYSYLGTNVIQNQDYKIIRYRSAVYIVYRIQNITPGCKSNEITDYTILTPVDNQQEDTIEIQEVQLRQQMAQLREQTKQLNQQADQLKEQEDLINQQADQLAEKDRIIMARTNLNKRLIDTLLIYKHKQPDGPTYDYQEIKSRKQRLHWEFKRLSKLMKLGK